MLCIDYPAEQLWHLAVADAFASILVLPCFTLVLLYRPEGFGSEPSTVQNVICYACHWNNIFIIASVFIEMHISLAAISIIHRRFEVLRVLSRSLPFLWVPAFVIGSAVTLQPIKWNHETGVCDVRSLSEDVKAVIMTIALAFCIATYIVGAVTAARRAGSSVEARLWRQTRLFVIAAVVTWGPFVAYSIFSRMSGTSAFVSKSGRPFYFVAEGLFKSNGLFNAVVYAVKSGYVVRVLQSGERGVIGQQHSPEAREAPRVPSDVSYAVAFDPDVEVAIVRGLTASANRRAQTEMENLSNVAGEGASHPWLLERRRAQEALLGCFDGPAEQSVVSAY